jgi:hypothetical protein
MTTTMKPYILPFAHVPATIERTVREMKRRVRALERAFEARTPPASSDRIRSVALASLFDAPVMLYALGHNGSTIVELHAWLERFALAEISKRLGRDPKSREEIAKLIARKTLGDCAELIRNLGVWTKDDVAFVRRLKRLRDAISHKNFELLGRTLGVSETMFRFNADKHLAKVDCVELILDTMELITKLTVRRRPGGRNAKTRTQSQSSRKKSSVQQLTITEAD